MKKFLLPAAFISLILASCSNEEFAGMTEQTQKKGEIGFSMTVPNLTRGTTMGSDAAQKLNNNFVVYGFKYDTSEPVDSAGVYNTKKQQDVFDYFNVNYIGNAGTTKTNSNGWEYVGYSNVAGTLQTMKYWDYTFGNYVFSAVSGVGITYDKILYNDSTNATVYDKGWNVTIPAGGSISALYASARLPLTKEPGTDKVNKFPETVNLTFYSMVTKIRFGIYETVPGYTVHIDKCYCYDGTDWSNNTTSYFGINGNFYGPNVTSPTNLKVTYYSDTTAVENRPKIEFDLSQTTKEVYKYFGSNMMATTAIGETSVQATYDKAGGEYTYILPYQSLKESPAKQNELKLYVDFTLTAPNGETIKVSQAEATVPTQYTQWKENFAYTYLFKISDNTNGTTGTPKDPDDPTKPWEPGDTLDPEGLYAITFDACIVNAEDGLSQEGIQEVITSITTPSITTYAMGTNATANSEYSADSIFYTAMDTTAVPEFISTAKSAVYQVIYDGDAPLTESLVADYNKGNGVMLVPVATKAATNVKLSDGTSLTFDANQCNVFKAEAGKNYVIVYNYKGKEIIKLVRVAGTATTFPSYSVKMKVSNDTIKTTDGKTTFKLLNGSDTVNIRGAVPFLKILKGAADVTENFTITLEDSVYVAKLTASAIAAGANGDYVVHFKNTAAAADDFTVDYKYLINYSGGASKATVVMNGTAANVGLTVNSVSYAGANITDVPAGINVTDKGNGKYEIAADETAATGKDSLYIAGTKVYFMVASYLFAPDTVKLVWAEDSVAPTAVIALKVDTTGIDTVAVSAATAYTSTVNTVIAAASTYTDGKDTITALDGGSTVLQYENATCDVLVEKYELNSSTATIARATQSTKLTLWINGVQQNAAIKTVVVKKWNTTDNKYETVTTGFALTSDGRDITFGNVSAAGEYRIEYTDGAATPKVLGSEVITVTE